MRCDLDGRGHGGVVNWEAETMLEEGQHDRIGVPEDASLPSDGSEQELQVHHGQHEHPVVDPTHA